jgi:hypothetical protein
MFDPFIILISLAVFLCALLTIYVLGGSIYKGLAFFAKATDKTTLWRAGLITAVLMVVAGIFWALGGHELQRCISTFSESL